MYRSIRHFCLSALAGGILVGCNRPPDAPIVQLLPQPAYTADALRVDWVAPSVDTNGRDEVSYTLTWTRGGEAMSELDDLEEVPGELTTKHELWAVTVTPADDKLEGPPASASLTISNSLPVAQVELPTEVPLADEPLLATASASDADEDEVELSWSWTRDGETTSYRSNHVPAEATSRGEIWVVTVVPFDGEEEGEPVTATASIANVAPSVTDLTLVPAQAYEATVVQARVETLDVDGDEVSLSHAWYVDGALVQEGDAGTLSGEHFDKHAVIHCVVTPSDGFVQGEAATSDTLTILDTPPLLAEATVSPAEVYEATDLSCIPAGWHDDDGDAEGTFVRWLVDGSEVCTDPTLTGAHFDRDQDVACELTPWDGEQTGEPVLSSAVTVRDTPPVATSATLSSTSPAEGDVLSVTVGGVSDDDGDDIELLYAWFVDGALVSTASTLDSGDFDKEQEIYVVVTPSDGTEEGAPVTSNVATAVNTAPVITVLDLSPTEPFTDDTLSTSVSTTDADGDEVGFSYAWYVDGALVSSTDSTLDGATWFDKDQDVYVVVTPDDGDEDGVSSTSDTLTVLNSPPAITDVTLDPEEIYEEDEVLCSPEGWSDADGDTEGYLYSWTVDGVEVSTSDTLTGADFDKGQALVCTVTPDDGDDEGEAVSSVELEVSNTAPALAGATLSTTSPAEEDTLTVTLDTATDADGDAISYSYDWYVQGSHAATSTRLDGDDFDKGDEIYVVVTPDDGTDAGEPVTSDVATAVNTPPEGSTVTLSPTTAYTSDTLSASASATDADGDSVSWTYAWYVDGTLVSATGSILPGATFFAKDQEVYVQATPSDGEDDGTAITSSSLTIANTPPSISSVSLSPTTAREASTLTCSPSGWSDADGDSAGYLYSWSVSGTSLSVSTSTLTGTYFDKGDTVSCTVTPDDGDDTGTAVSSGSLTIVNTAPSLSGAALSDSSPAEGDTLSVVLGSATDADGDTISYAYAWYVEGSRVSTASTLSSSSFDKHDEIYCVITPSDGTDSGTAVTTATATAVNTPPVASSVSLSPTTVYTNGTLTASASGTDADGDTLTWTWAWSVDGTTLSATGSSLSGVTWFDKDEAVVVTATPSDGEEDGTALSSSAVTCANTPPTQPAVSIDPAMPLEGEDDLWCEVTTASTDADGDAVSYAFSWYQDGASFSSTSTTVHPDDTVGSSWPVGGDQWICVATPDDGDDYGTSAAAAVDIYAWDGAREFGTCGQTGPTGPSQSLCDSAYSATTLDGEVSVSGGIQSWTVPFDGTYLIEAMGAQGASGDTRYLGGLGAYVSGEFTLYAGDVLEILVGQMGQGQSSGSNGGGGGGTFVVDQATGSPLLVAGGGGGTRTSVDQDGCDGWTSPYGMAGSADSTTNTCASTAGTLGYGGAVSFATWGSGGGGMYGDGSDDYTDGGGWSYANGGTGGGGTGGCGDQAYGGFGGGGSGRGCYGGGGGGGYSGGEGGRVAGGGGSYNAGSSPSSSSGYQSGHGEVSIERL